MHEVILILEVGSWASDNVSCLVCSSNLCNKTTPEFTISVLNAPLYSRLDPLYSLTASDFILLISYELIIVNCDDLWENEMLAAKKQKIVAERRDFNCD